MDQVRAYIGGGLAALAIVPTLFFLFVLNGASSGVVPLPTVEEEPPPSSGPSRFPLNPDINWTLLYGTLLAMVVVALSILAFLAWRRPRFGPDYHAPIATNDSQQTFDEFVARLGQDSNYERAIRLAFEAVENRIEHLPPRVLPETPFEWSQRVGQDHPHLHDPLETLCSHYARARFAPEQTTAQQRDETLTALRQLKHMSDSVVVPRSLVPVLPWA